MLNYSNIYNLYSLTEASKINSTDGPTLNLLKVMRNHGFVAPEDWKMYRPLTSK